LVFDLVMAFLRLATYRWRKHKSLRLKANGRPSDLALGVQRMRISNPLSSADRHFRRKKSELWGPGIVSVSLFYIAGNIAQL
jgi:hypothetical protein